MTVVPHKKLGLMNEVHHIFQKSTRNIFSSTTTMVHLIAILQLLLAVLVSANTEQLRFIFEAATQAPLNTTFIAGQLNDKSQGPFGAFRSNHVQQIFPSFSASDADYYIISGIPGRTYEARICWAASDPLKFSMEYLADSGILKVSYEPEYYSHLPELQKQPLPAKYDVVLNPILFGALPSDILMTIVQVVVGGIGAYLVSGVALKYI